MAAERPKQLAEKKELGSDLLSRTVKTLLEEKKTDEEAKIAEAIRLKIVEFHAQGILELTQAENILLTFNMCAFIRFGVEDELKKLLELKEPSTITLWAKNFSEILTKFNFRGEATIDAIFGYDFPEAYMELPVGTIAEIIIGKLYTGMASIIVKWNQIKEGPIKEKEALTREIISFFTSTRCLNCPKNFANTSNDIINWYPSFVALHEKIELWLSQTTKDAIVPDNDLFGQSSGNTTRRQQLLAKPVEQRIIYCFSQLIDFTDNETFETVMSIWRELSKIDITKLQERLWRNKFYNKLYEFCIKNESEFCIGLKDIIEKEKLIAIFKADKLTVLFYQIYGYGWTPPGSPEEKNLLMSLLILVN
jgi:hypothetical protein